MIAQNKKRQNLAGYQLKKFDNTYIGYIPDGEIEAFMSKVSGSVLFVGSDNQKKFLKSFEVVKGKNNTAYLILSKKK